MPHVFVANCRPDNWKGCVEGRPPETPPPVFGIRKESFHPAIEAGDIFLMRVTREGGGLHGIWAFQGERRVQSPSEVPWKDGEYEWLLFFNPLLLELREPFDEEFRGRARAYSEKIGLFAGQIVQSVILLKQEEAKTYIEALVEEKREELKVTAHYLKRPVVVADLLEEIATGGKVAEATGLSNVGKVFWQISPGEEKDGFWPEFREKGIIAMGFAELGDLSRYSTKEQLEKPLKEFYDEGRNSVNSCWTFSKEIKPGHIIVAKHGSSRKLYGIGRALVASNSRDGKSCFEFDDSRQRYKNVIRVKWYVAFDEPFEVNTSKQFVQWAAHTLEKDRFEEIRTSILDKRPELAPEFESLLGEPHYAENVYLLARTVPNPRWPDVEGKELHFGTNVANYLKVIPGANLVFDKTVEGKIHFLGCARVARVEDVGSDQTEEGKQFVRKIAHLRDYVKFDPPRQITSGQLGVLQTLPSYNQRNALVSITKELFESITKVDERAAPR